MLPFSGTAATGNSACHALVLTRSLDVLDLLADFFQLGFGFDDGLGDGGVVGFGPDGVELAEEFLAEEVEGAAGGVGGIEVLAGKWGQCANFDN